MSVALPQARIALVLGVAATLAAAGVFPYLFAVQPSLLALPVSPAMLVATQSIGAGIACLLMAWIGLALGAPVGLSAPWLAARLYGRARPAAPAWRQAALLGVLAALLVLGAIALFGAPVTGPATPPATFAFAMKGLLASPYGAVVEEVALRVFLLGLIAWMLCRVAGQQALSWIMPVAIVAAAVAFGAAHLPLAASIAPLTTAVVARVIIYNALGGVLFGWLYWKRGLEHAMLAHLCADLVLHVATPLLAT